MHKRRSALVIQSLAVRERSSSGDSLIMSEMYKLGDLVWAKMKGFSPWPGRVSIPSKDLKKPGNTKRGPVQCIFFFGTNN
ncbi:PREDICTED: putative oxidoreductase GLYR1 homolog [Polistes canadensis]|uniref:putative oxidoreductase GLYR1 homolog n=1 Tax=Polistes canadensis TaxID=91411 RepID=UPI000718FBC7|nr:PREDICTED: putative oxidoreductase GLYR1 homolog [Polistes canadensis]